MRLGFCCLLISINIFTCFGQCDYQKCVDNISTVALQISDYNTYCSSIHESESCFKKDLINCQQTAIYLSTIDTLLDTYCNENCSLANISICSAQYTKAVGTFTEEIVSSGETDEICKELKKAESCFDKNAEFCQNADVLSTISAFTETVNITIRTYCGACALGKQLNCSKIAAQIYQDTSEIINTTTLCPIIAEALGCYRDILPTCDKGSLGTLEQTIGNLELTKQNYCSDDGCGLLDMYACFSPISELSIDMDDFENLPRSDQIKACRLSKGMMECITRKKASCAEAVNTIEQLEQNIQEFQFFFNYCESIIDDPCDWDKGAKCVDDFDWKLVFNHPEIVCRNYDKVVKCVHNAFSDCHDNSSIRLDVFGIEFDSQAMQQMCNISDGCSMEQFDICFMKLEILDESMTLDLGSQCGDLQDFDSCLSNISEDCQSPILTSMKKKLESRKEDLDVKCKVSDPDVGSIPTPLSLSTIIVLITVCQWIFNMLL